MHILNRLTVLFHFEMIDKIRLRTEIHKKLRKKPINLHLFLQFFCLSIPDVSELGIA